MWKVAEAYWGMQGFVTRGGPPFYNTKKGAPRGYKVQNFSRVCAPKPPVPARSLKGKGTMGRPAHPAGRARPARPARPLISGKGEIRPARPARKNGPISVSSRRNAKFGEPAVGGLTGAEKTSETPQIRPLLIRARRPENFSEISLLEAIEQIFST